MPWLNSLLLASEKFFVWLEAPSAKAEEAIPIGYLFN